ncbi:MarR family transcriptional regulator [Caenimonas sedimenti]|uniref:MarR family transcriptional regulator n=1 Tax=Caenimonas sedimenti TaxID=2596921 RepID=A0A562ZPK3_9BURK|nr:MarR family transcriptional regulator [Caenimonas sedimenti]TWO70337.1 MarR family transcriptional regulator [Caenimonas sedimenti]
MAKTGDIVNHPGAGTDEGADDVLELVHRLMHDYRALQYRALRDAPHGVTHMEAKVLAFFQRHPGATQSDLAQHSGRDKAQLARLIKSLRERDLLVAEVDAADRRNVRLSLSPEGLAIQRALRVQAKKLGAKAVRGLSEREHHQLLALLRKVRGNLAEE